MSGLKTPNHAGQMPRSAQLGCWLPPVATRTVRLGATALRSRTSWMRLTFIVLGADRSDRDRHDLQVLLALLGARSSTIILDAADHAGRRALRKRGDRTARQRRVPTRSGSP